MSKHGSRSLPAESERVASAVVEVAKHVLGERLKALVVHGSAVKGGYIKGFSDFDFVIYMSSRLTAADALALHRGVSDIDPAPFAYLQLGDCVDLEGSNAVDSWLVPGAAVAVYGEVPRGAWGSAETLRESGEEWLAKLPGLIDHDLRDWAFATGALRTRTLRLAMTRLLPALRALLVRAGAEPTEVWAAPLPELIELWQVRDGSVGQTLSSLVDRLPGDGSTEEALGREVFRLLLKLSGDGSP